MLLEFTVRNYLSIKDEVTLNMVASKDNFKDKENTIIYDEQREKKALKLATIYGANASGKSNIIKAMNFVSDFVNGAQKMQQGKLIRRVPFKLNRASYTEPSEFKIVFISEGIKYVYMFSVTELRVEEEYLYYYPNGRQSTIFERVKDKYKFTVDEEIQREIKNKFHSDNKLFLSVESLWEYEKAKVPFKWFQTCFNVYLNHEEFEGDIAIAISQDDNLRHEVKKFLRYADIDIEDIFIDVKRKDDFISSEFFKHLPDVVKLDIEKQIGENSLILNKNDIRILHRGIDENGESFDVFFKLPEESEGTQKYFMILGPLINTLKKGSTIVIDELDVRLHTLLVKKLVEMFLNPEVNKRNAQLIFTTHDTNLLDSNILRRDQIWFTEKKKDKSTDLYSLYDFGGVRKDDKLEKGYLQGKYGAIPYFTGDLE